MTSPSAPATRILTAARELFLSAGYRQTTIHDIASRAEVALATIYKRYGSKVGILAALQDQAVAGDDTPTALLERDWVRALPRRPVAEGLERVIDEFSRATERAAPILGIIIAAGSDPKVGELLDSLHQQRQHSCLAIASALVPAERAAELADRLYALLGVEVYELLVVRRGWTMAEWTAWTTQCLAGYLRDSPQA